MGVSASPSESHFPKVRHLNKSPYFPRGWKKVPAQYKGSRSPYLWKEKLVVLLLMQGCDVYLLIKGNAGFLNPRSPAPPQLTHPLPPFNLLCNYRLQKVKPLVTAQASVLIPPQIVSVSFLSRIHTPSLDLNSAGAGLQHIKTVSFLVFDRVPISSTIIFF